jgi:hypothetical protein
LWRQGKSDAVGQELAVMAHSGSKRKQADAIAALLTQPSIEKAAFAAKIGSRTLYRWLRTPEFKEAYDRARLDAFSQTMGRLQQASSAAATILLKVALDAKTPSSVRVRAADSILGHALRAAALQAVESNLVEPDGEKRVPTPVRTERPGLLQPGGEALKWHENNPGVPPDETVIEPPAQVSGHLQ